MARISTGIGLISGINSKDIIDQLMALEEQPKTLLQQRIDQTNQQKLAYTDLLARLTSLKLSGTTLKKTSTFQASSATSSNEDVLTATGSTGAAKGSYSFQVARLVNSQQSISGGYASENTKVSAGTLTIEMGGGEIDSETLLSQLNGGEGVHRGAFRITDGSGQSAIIDISTALTLDDVVKRINTSLDISVKAEVQGDKLVVKDQSGQSTANFGIVDLGGGSAAADLGIAGAGVAGVIDGADINRLGRSTALAQLNDGRGIRMAASGADFRIQASDGTTWDITLNGASTLGAVFDKITAATGGKVSAAIGSDGKSIALTDSSGGGGAFQVTALNGSKAAADLGIEQTGTGGQIAGKTILASLDTVLLSSMRGGTGLDLGTVNITDRAGNAATVDLSGAETVQDILDRINANGTAKVTAKLKDSGNGIQIVDTSGGTGNLVIADGNSTTAAELGIAGTFASTAGAVNGANLQRQWINENTLLSGYNAGRGVTAGKFTITDSAGNSSTIDLSSVSGLTLGDVINKINTATTGKDGTGGRLGVTASINANGDGLLLTDTAGGTGKLTVSEVDSTTAADLKIRGAATATTIDGTFEKTISVSDTDTLAAVMANINKPGYALSANIINDGSGATPYRLALTARNSGRAGRVVFDAGTTGLGTTNLVEAQDAVVLYGGADSTQPLLITSGSNKLGNLIKGVTIDLHSVSSSPVTLDVTDNIENVVAELNKFTDNFNGFVDKLQELTKYDSATNTRGVLLGEGAVSQIESELYGISTTVVAGLGSYKMLAQLGLKMVSGAKLQFDEDKFRAAYAADPESVKNLFSAYQTADGSTASATDKTASTVVKKGLGYLIEDRINRLIDPASGIITLQNKTLDDRTNEFQDRISQIDKQLDTKRTRLERQFANLESVLANLQSQQSALASLSGVSATATAKK